MKKIGIIGIRGLPALYGAFDRFVEQFVSSHKIKSQKLFFYISCDISFKKFKFDNNIVKRVFIFRGLSFFILINYLISIIRLYFYGVRCFVFFGYGAAPFFILLKILNCQIICNPDGIEWKRPVGKIKELYFKICEKLLSSVNITRIFDSKVIERYYNINHSAKGTTIYYPSIFENNKILKNINCTKNFERFYIIGRLLEENNTEMIVNTFMKLGKKQKLYVIGNSNNFFKKKIKPLILRSKNITYLGPIYDQKKLFNICRHFDYYIHGHSVGGTNPTLIESISLQKKIIAFDTTFNREILKTDSCFFKNENELLEIIKMKKYRKKKIPVFREEFTSRHINNAYLNLIN